MRSDDDSLPLSDLPRSRLGEEEVVDRDILADLVRDAIGVLSGLRHEELAKEVPDPAVVERITERKRRFAAALSSRAFGASAEADRLRDECLELIRGGTP
ncbi:hypothetical protein [Nocardiopsis sp. NPDC006938]|uniref:hypothetical protein n=1 Tax=Nocardiopsis sp. NPDC006938 TaxID=3364337 RepID=UPI00369B91A2